MLHNITQPFVAEGNVDSSVGAAEGNGDSSVGAAEGNGDRSVGAAEGNGDSSVRAKTRVDDASVSETCNTDPNVGAMESADVDNEYIISSSLYAFGSGCPAAMNVEVKQLLRHTTTLVYKLYIPFLFHVT